VYQIPDINAVARGLSRTQRFNGDTLVPWTVLQHTLAGFDLFPEGDVVARFAWGLHDAEEALTGDIPKVFKTPEQSALGDEIRDRIYRALKFPTPVGPLADRIKEVDALLAVSEAEILSPPATREEFLAYGEPAPDRRAMDLIWGLTDMTPREAEYAYLEIMQALAEDRKVRSLQGRV